MGSLYALAGVLIRRARRECMLFPWHLKTHRGNNHLRIRKRAHTWNWISGCLDLGFPFSRAVRKLVFTVEATWFVVFCQDKPTELLSCFLHLLYTHLFHGVSVLTNVGLSSQSDNSIKMSGSGKDREIQTQICLICFMCSSDQAFFSGTICLCVFSPLSRHHVYTISTSR